MSHFDFATQEGIWVTRSCVVVETRTVEWRSHFEPHRWYPRSYSEDETIPLVKEFQAIFSKRFP